MRRSLSVIAAIALGISGCSVPLESSANDLTEQVPDELLPAEEVVPTTLPAATRTLSIYLARRASDDSFRLALAAREVAVGTRLRGVLEVLFTTSAQDDEPDLFTQISGGEEVEIQVEQSPLPGVIDLTLDSLEPLTNQDAPLQTLAFAQLVCTTLRNNVDFEGVRILLVQDDGERAPVAPPITEGETGSAPAGEAVQCERDYAAYFLPDPLEVVVATTTTTVP